ncbi:MAG: prepilin peptidase [bacterium]|nr:prepilin peptidase [bacterium]
MLKRRIGTAVAASALGGVAAVSDVEAALFALWLATLAAVSWCDLRTRRIPTGIVNPATVIGAAALGATAWRVGTGARLGAAAATAAAAYAAFALLHALNPGGLGYGDVRLSGLLGLFLGWLGPAAMPAGTLLGAAGAALAALVMLLSRRDRRSTLPFGPFLAAGAATVALLHSAAPLGFG